MYGENCNIDNVLFFVLTCLDWVKNTRRFEVKKSRLIGLIIIVILFSIAISCTKIPKQIGDWRVEVGPPGNDFYEDPQETAPQNIPPSDKLLHIVQEFAPSYTEVTKWKMLNKNLYWIRSAAGVEKWDYTIFQDGTIQDITYRNDSTKTREKAYALLIKDGRVSIPVEEVPPRALEVIKVVFPESEPSQTWIASTFAGTRYLIVVEGMAFYARPDGQIQSARFTNSGGLEENYRNTENEDEIINEIMSEAKEIPTKYRDRFNFDKQIMKIKSKPLKPNSPFRFIIMGDSRSNAEFWSIELKHIAALSPKPAFVINSGDLVARGFVNEFQEYFIPPLLDFDIPYLIAIGNHDFGYKKKAIEYRYLFGDNSLNYYFDYGEYRFIMIDNVTAVQPYSVTVEWLDKVLSETPKNFHKIIVAHSPFGNIDKWRFHVMDKEYSKAFGDLMSKYKVDHVFFGHIHGYSTATLNGVDYTVSGGGGAGLYDRFGPKGNVYHYIICDVLSDGTLKQQVVRFYKNEPNN